MFTNVGFVYTDVGFHLNSGFTKKLCTHIFPLGTQGLGIKELAEDSLYGLKKGRSSLSKKASNFPVFQVGLILDCESKKKDLLKKKHFCTFGCLCIKF